METLPSTMDAFEQNEPPAPPAPFEDVPCHSHAPPSWHLYRKQGSRRSRLNEAFSKELPRGEHLTVESTPLIPHLIPHLLELPFDTGALVFSVLAGGGHRDWRSPSILLRSFNDQSFLLQVKHGETIPKGKGS